MFEKDELMARGGVIEEIKPLAVLVNGPEDLEGLSERLDPGSVAYTPGEAQSWQLSPAREWVECVGGMTASPLEATENGTYDAGKGAAYNPVTVNVPQTEVQPLTATQNGVYEAEAGAAYNPVTVDVPATEATVLFVDYDGTEVAKYSPEAFAALEAMPENPVHEGLTSKGWNWELADAKAYVAKYGMLVIGQTYDTDDGTTRLYIRLADPLPSARGTVTLAFQTSVENGAQIDWGDGSDAETVGNGTSNQSYSHTYARGGDYLVRIKVLEGQITLQNSGRIGTSASDLCLYGVRSGTVTWNQYYIVRAEIGESFTIGKYAFSYCMGMESIVLPSGVTEIPEYCFYCSGIKALTVPKQVTSMGNRGASACSLLRTLSLPKGLDLSANAGTAQFYNCTLLQRAAIPEATTALPGSLFSGAKYLRRVAIPDTVTEIGDYCFSDCYDMEPIPLRAGLVRLGNSCFSNCKRFEHVAIPEGVERLGDSVFNGCQGIRSVTFEGTSPGLTLGSSLWSGTNNLTTLELCEGIAAIPEGMIDNAAVVSITIPESVTAIASKAFQRAYNLGAVHMKRSTPPTLQSDSFGTSLTDFIIYVPEASVSAYKNATNWKNYADRIQAEPA